MFNISSPIDPDIVINTQVGIYGLVFGVAFIAFGVLWGWKKYKQRNLTR